MSGVARTTTTEDGVEGPVAEPPGEHAHPTLRLRYSLPGWWARWSSCACRSPPRCCPATASSRGGLRHHRGDRVRHRRAGRVDVARLRRPGRAAPAAPVLAGLRRRRRACLVAAMAFGRYWQGQIRALMDDAGGRPRVARRLAAGRRARLRLLVARRPRAAWPVPVDGQPARPLDRASAPPGPSAGSRSSRDRTLLVSGVLLDGLVGAADEAFSVRDTMTEEGVEPADQRLRSGGPARSCRGTRSAGRAASSPARGRRRRADRGVRRRPRAGADPGVRRPGIGRGHRGTRPAWPSTTWSGPAGSSAANLVVVDDHRQRLGGPGRGGSTASSTSAAATPRPSPIQYSYLPVVDLLPGRPDRRRARPAGTLFDAVYDRWSKLPQDQPARSCTSPARASGRSAARRPSAASTTCATAPPGRCSPGRRTSTRCSASSATTATRAARRSSRSTENGRTVRFASDPGRRRSARRVSRGTGRGCST